MKFEEKLAQAFKETCDERAERLMKVEKKHRFSLSYKLWERKMLRDLRRNRVDKRWTLKKAKYTVTAMAAAFVLLIGGTAYGATMLRNFRFEEKTDHTNLFLERYSTDKTSFDEIYWLPPEDGWIFANIQTTNMHTAIRLHLRRGDTLVIFWQNLIEDHRLGHIYNEYPDIEHVSVNLENDGFVTDYRGDGTTLGWVYDGYYFEMLCKDMSKDELIELAHTITTVTPEELRKYDDPDNKIYCERELEYIGK